MSVLALAVPNPALRRVEWQESVERWKSEVDMHEFYQHSVTAVVW